MYTLETVYTVAMPHGLSVLIFAEFLTSLFTLASLVVISHYDGFVVQKYPLQAPIRTSNDTYLLTKPCKDKVEYPGEDKQRNKGIKVFQWSLFDLYQQLITTDDIGQKDIGHHKGNQKEDEPFQPLLADFFPVPSLFVQFHLRIAVTLYGILHATENHLKENRLRTDPPTKDTPKGHRKEQDKDHSYNHRKHKKVKVLWPKRKTKDIKPSL